MRAGGTVAIPLRVYGRQGVDTRYLIRVPPKLGRILALEEAKPEIWLLTYQHTAAMKFEGEDRDLITYVAQNKNGTSANADIEIIIRGAPPILVAPNEVNFGQIIMGSIASQTFKMSNSGGSLLEGDFSVEKPFAIEPSRYALEPGETASFTVTLDAAAEQQYKGWIRVTDKSFIQLKGEATDPLTVTPRALDLTGKPGQPRTGLLSLGNTSGEELTLQIRADKRLGLQGEVTIPPNEIIALAPALNAGDTEGFDGDIQIRWRNYVKRVHVGASAVGSIGPALAVSAWEVDFGTTTVGTTSLRTVTVSNNGKKPLSVDLATAEPFSLAKSALLLNPSENLSVDVQFKPGWPGLITGALRVSTKEEPPISISLTASGVNPPGILPPPGTPRSTSSKTAAPEGEPVRRRSSVPAVRDITVKKVTTTTAEIYWEPPIKDPAKSVHFDYRIDVGITRFNQEGDANTEWIPLPTVKLTKESGRVTALLYEIPAGIGVTARVITISPKGEASEPSSAFQFFTEPRRPFFTLKRVLLAFFTLLLAGALWVRHRLQ